MRFALGFLAALALSIAAHEISVAIMRARLNPNVPGALARP